MKKIVHVFFYHQMEFIEAILQYAFDDELHKKEQNASSVFNKWEPVFSQMI